MVDPLRPASLRGIRVTEYVDFLGTDFENRNALDNILGGQYRCPSFELERDAR
jgi:hypothetical protein